jgi:hypothetical protein
LLIAIVPREITGGVFHVRHVHDNLVAVFLRNGTKRNEGEK